jgi:hypothetical protein
MGATEDSTQMLGIMQLQWEGSFLIIPTFIHQETQEQQEPAHLVMEQDLESLLLEIILALLIKLH